MRIDESYAPARNCERPPAFGRDACRAATANYQLCDPCKRRIARAMAARLLRMSSADREALGYRLASFGVTNALEACRLAHVDQFRRGAEFNRLCARGWREKYATVLP
jgi:hypothetical protein